MKIKLAVMIFPGISINLPGKKHKHITGNAVRGDFSRPPDMYTSSYYHKIILMTHDASYIFLLPWFIC